MRTGLHQLGYQFSDEAIVTDGASAGGYNSAITVVASPNLWPSPYSDLLPGVSVAVLGGIDEFGPSGDVPPYDPAPDGAVVPHITPATPPLYIIQGSRDCTVVHAEQYQHLQCVGRQRRNRGKTLGGWHFSIPPTRGGLI